MEAASRNLLSFISMLPTCFILGLWDVESDNDGQQEGCVLRVYVNVAFSKKTVWKSLPLLNDDESLVYIVCSFIIYVFLVSHLCI
ncbi:hypothetical protein ES288_D05G356200v1 [Gossypium darwinii]|uniref:Uncharacterized protein n=2 Tax=Gossypium TaxID=3633 RepID=A0A5D2L432_GOSTO|nr:hypothetical protein ES288_D05G356200v1 [Gossypium darwinii]TYH73829.1 hypothetical protein ES332_D05G355800v1 [Gossypium tomentosum]